MKFNQINKAFDLANSAKNFQLYGVANVIFARLLDLALDNPAIKIEYESQLDEDELLKFINGDNSFDTYYDLVVLKFNEKSLNIPVPLLKSGVAKACIIESLESGAITSKLEHNRCFKKRLPGQREYLMRELVRVCPDYTRYTKYLDVVVVCGSKEEGIHLRIMSILPPGRYEFRIGTQVHTLIIDANNRPTVWNGYSMLPVEPTGKIVTPINNSIVH